MMDGISCYRKREGTGWINYVKDIMMLNIKSVDKNGKNFGDYILQSRDYNVSGKSIQSLQGELNSIINKYNLVAPEHKTADAIIIYVADLDIIRAYLPNKYLAEDKWSRWITYNGVIQFRDWSKLLPAQTLDTQIWDILQYWETIFWRDKRPYFSIAQYPRKTMLRPGDVSDQMPANEYALEIIYTALHAGVLHSDYQSMHTDNIVGADIKSAYIHSILFKKHAMSAPKKINTETYQEYIDNPNYGSVGIYEIDYDCDHDYIRCYTPITNNMRAESMLSDTPLQPGRHTVYITLCDIDLKTLLSLNGLTIYSIKCITLYTFKLDYLPDYIRDYCAKQFILKECTDHDSVEGRMQKTILNSGFFGNFLFESNAYLQRHDTFYNRLKQNASANPIWGIYTCAYVRKTILTIATQLDGWVYSDTDSIYAMATTRNNEIIMSVNEQIWTDNMVTMDLLKYPEEQRKYLGRLGQFKFENLIIKFKFWAYKRYAFKTIDNKIVVKASGTPEELIVRDESVFEITRLPVVMAVKEFDVKTKHYYLRKLII